MDVEDEAQQPCRLATAEIHEKFLEDDENAYAEGPAATAAAAATSLTLAP